jgi:hypothetical protein
MFRCRGLQILFLAADAKNLPQDFWRKGDACAFGVTNTN